MAFGCGAQNPSILVFTPIVVAIFCVLMVLRDRERLRRTKLVGADAIETPRWRLWCLVAGSLFALGGVSRPYCGMEQIEVPTLSSDRIFVVDISRSMLTKDVQPSRIELAKRKMRDYLSESARRGIQERAGIVLFAGSSYLYCPLTDDQLVLGQFIESISPDLVTALGSNLEAGLKSAVTAFERARSKHPAILLLSDGEDPNQKQQSAILQILQSREITVDVLAVGTSDGKPIELGDGRFLRDTKNEIVVSKLQDAFLRRLAVETRGTYAIAGVRDADVTSILQRVKASEKASMAEGTRQSSVITTYGEFGYLLMIPACVLFALAIAPRGHGILLRVLIPLFVLWTFPKAAFSQEATNESMTARDGFLAYQRGDFRAAKEALGRAHATYPKDRDIAQALASSLYQLGDFAGAEALFQTLREQAPTGKTRYENSFNLGNARYMQDNMEGAIAAYESALRIKPEDVPASNNLALAKKRLEHMKNQPTPSPTPAASPTSNATTSPTSKPGTPTPSGSPTAGASPSSSPTAQGSPSPGGTPSKAPGDSTPNPDGEGSTPTAAATGSSRSEESSEGTPTPGSPQSTPHPEPVPSPNSAQTPNGSATPDQQTMSQREANTWLDSLPDSPLLLRRNMESSHSGGQTW